jgi:hypothetical protein
MQPAARAENGWRWECRCICTCGDHCSAPSPDARPEQVPQLAGLVKQPPVAVARLVRNPAPWQAAILAAAFCPRMIGSLSAAKQAVIACAAGGHFVENSMWCSGLQLNTAG